MSDSVRKKRPKQFQECVSMVYPGSVRLKLSKSLSVTLFIALFIQPTFIVQPVLYIDIIDKNSPLTNLKKAKGRGRRGTR